MEGTLVLQDERKLVDRIVCVRQIYFNCHEALDFVNLSKQIAQTFIMKIDCNLFTRTFL